MTDRLDELENRIREGYCRLTISEGNALFFEYIREAIRIMKELHSKSQQ
jgi:hypothetical protein